MSALHHLRRLCSAWIRDHGSDDELTEEIRYHIEMESARQVAGGHDAIAAHRRALERFGDPALIIQSTREERGALRSEKLMHDLRSALRALRKHQSFTILALLTLTLGIGATTTAFTVLDTVLLRPLPYRGAGRLVLLQERTAKGMASPVSYPNFADWRADTHTFSGVASEMYPWAQTVTAGADPVRATVMGVSLGFFSVLGTRPLLGREFTADEERPGGSPAIMVSYDFWKTQLGGRADLGTIRFGDTPMPVVGVLPQGFRFVDDADLYFPHEQWPGTCRSCHNYRVLARLGPGATLAGARAEMTTLSRRLFATWGTETLAVDASVAPLREYLVGGYQTILMIVLAAATLVLLISCTNLVTAQLARGMSRSREIAVRGALGASRARLVRQLFLESAVLALAGAALGTALAMLLAWSIRLLGAGLVRRLDELRVDGTVLLFVIGVTAVTAVLIGLYPALRVSGRNPGQLLHGARGSSVTLRATAWRVLVGFEIAMAIVLLVGAGLMIRTLRNILVADTGFKARNVVTAALAPGDTVNLARFEEIRVALAALPGVRGVAFTNHLPLDWSSTNGPVRRPTDPVDHDWPAMAGFRLVSADYFKVLQQPIARGRSFTAGDAAGSGLVAIITPGIAEALWPGQDPIGKQIATNYLVTQSATSKWVDQWLTIVGVAAEASSWTMPRGQQNEIYVPLAQHPTRSEGDLVAVVGTTTAANGMIPSIRTQLHALAPEMPSRLGTLDDRIARSAADRRFAMAALTLFGAIALLLAGIGIYGTMAYTVAARTHEIGVRMALGATPARVRIAVLADAAGTAAGGIVIGLIAGFFATGYLRTTLYGVSHVDPLAYFAGAGILLVTALLGAYVPARRSSKVDPLLAIRAE